MLPEPILAAAVRRPLGGISIIGGAGCSLDEPTSIPLSRRCSEDAYHQLEADGLLKASDCAEDAHALAEVVGDLSKLADIVYKKYGSQQYLVDRLPISKFRFARANEGYLLLGALFREQVIASFVTLNFDLAVLNALSNVGAEEEVAIIRCPEEHGNHRAHNVVYLHRSVEANADDWILRTEQFDSAWASGWQELIALRVVSNPITVFVGLGTVAGVLIQSVVKVRTAAPAGTQVYLVNPGAKERSPYFQVLTLPDENYIQLGWAEFMEQLSDRVLVEQRRRLVSSCLDARAAEALDENDVGAIVSRATAAGLLGLGSLRARWMMKPGDYHPEREAELPFIASVLIALRVIEKYMKAEAVFREYAAVDFKDGAKSVLCAAFIIVPGKRWLALEGTLHRLQRRWSGQNPAPSCVFVCGAVGPRLKDAEPPEDLVSADKPDSIVSPSIDALYDVEEVRLNPAIALSNLEHER